jgi:hypothetical protein
MKVLLVFFLLNFSSSFAISFRDSSQLPLSYSSSSLLALNLSVGDYPPEEMIRASLWKENLPVIWKCDESKDDWKDALNELKRYFFLDHAVKLFWDSNIEVSFGDGLPLRKNGANEKVHVRQFESDFGEYFQGFQKRIEDLFVVKVEKDIAELKKKIFPELDDDNFEDAVRRVFSKPVKDDTDKYGDKLNTLYDEFWKKIEWYGARIWKSLDELILTNDLSPETCFLLSSYIPFIKKNGKDTKLEPIVFFRQMLMLYIFNAPITTWARDLPGTTLKEKNRKQFIVKATSSLQSYSSSNQEKIDTYAKSENPTEKEMARVLTAMDEYFREQLSWKYGEEDFLEKSRINCFDQLKDCNPEDFLPPAQGRVTAKLGYRILNDILMRFFAIITKLKKVNSKVNFVVPDFKTGDNGIIWKKVWEIEATGTVKNPGTFVGWKSLSSSDSLKGTVTFNWEGITVKLDGVKDATTEPWANADGSLHLVVDVASKDKDDVHRNSITVATKSAADANKVKWFKLVSSEKEQHHWASQILEVSIRHTQKVELFGK